ncbi:MAG: thioredoxin [Gemmataceae bacterium]|nr:thioredoxin [Gemmataceae bacterium]
MSTSPFVFEVTEKDFDTKVLQQSKDTPVVVDFWAPWCGPCRMLAPVLEKLVDERRGAVLLAKVNTDEEQRLAAQYFIESLPTVIAFRDGKPALDFVGLVDELDIRAFLDRLAPTEAEKSAGAAAKLEQSDPAKAEQLYRQALKDDPRQEAALLGLARVLIGRDQDAEAAELIENVGAGGEHGAEAERLGALIWLKRKAAECKDEDALRTRMDAEPSNAPARYELGLRRAVRGEYRPALDLLLSAGELDRNLAGGPVREAMVKIFHVVGVRDPLADEYRAKLSALLY